MKLIILGAGVSGLSLAHYLSSRGNHEIVILEKSRRAGGWIETNAEGRFFFEKGPRTFKAGASSPLYALVQELGLEDEMIFTPKEARKRYLWTEGKLQKVPRWNFALLKALVKEFFVPPVIGDESVSEFAARRFGNEAAKQFFAPMVRGIYAGEADMISAYACFPKMKEMEEKHGSVLKGLFLERKEKGMGLFTFQSGMQRLVEKLEERFRSGIRYGCEAQAVHFTQNGVEVVTNSGVVRGDFVFCALPAAEAGRLFAPELCTIASKSLCVVNLGYEKDVLPYAGFGYLAAPQYDGVLGVIFDSNCFPQQNSMVGQTRLTAMVGGDGLSDEGVETLCLDALREHLGIVAAPDEVRIWRAQNAIPQLLVGHREKIGGIEKKAREKFPRLFLAGNYFLGAGVADCVAKAKEASGSFFNAIAS